MSWGTTWSGRHRPGRARRWPDQAEAEAKLAAELPAVADAPIAVRVTDGEETFNLVPPESGLGIDIEATVGAVPGASANPFSLGAVWCGRSGPGAVGRPGRFGGGGHSHRRAGRRRASQRLCAFADGAVVTSPATLGRMVDVAAGADAIETTYFGAPGPHELPLPITSLPTREVEPAITDADVEEAVDGFAEPAMSGPVTVTAGGRTAILEPAMIGAALTMVPDDNGVLVPALARRSPGRGGGRCSGRDRARRPRCHHHDRQRATGHQSEPVRPGVPPDALAAAVLPVLTASGDDRTAELELTEVEPRLDRRGK